MRLEGGRQHFEAEWVIKKDEAHGAEGLLLALPLPAEAREDSEIRDGGHFV